MSFFQKRSVAVICCILMIMAALAIGQGKHQQAVTPMQEVPPDGWSQVYVNPDDYGQPEYTVLGTSLRVVGGIVVFILLIGTLVLLSVISAVSRLCQRLLIGRRNPVFFRNRTQNYNSRSSHKSSPHQHSGMDQGSNTHRRPSNRKR